MDVEFQAWLDDYLDNCPFTPAGDIYPITGIVHTYVAGDCEGSPEPALIL